MSLEDVLTSVRQARLAASSAGGAAVSYVQAHEPALAEALGSLGLGVEEAGIWLITSGNIDAPSPIELVATGRAKDVVDNILRTLHGFSG